MYIRDKAVSRLSTLTLAGTESSLDPVESMIIHRYSPADSSPAFIKCSTLVTLLSGLPISVDGGKPALEISAVVPHTNDKGSAPLAVQLSSISLPSLTTEPLGWSTIVSCLDSVHQNR